ncbi:hypothetical protein GCM10027347_00330 [Larkinella harenae]
MVDLIDKQLRQEAALAFQAHQLPTTADAYQTQRTTLRQQLWEKTRAVVQPDLPLHYQETGSVPLNGYSVKNILFQTRPGIYATANLYVPDGKGPFPAVIQTHGHWPNGHIGDIVQSIGHILAQEGYVSLILDAWGAGERSTKHGEPEYHGSNLGASLLNVGETLLGMQLTDNIRGVDLLSSLPFVDAGKIGATGASGGGNQCMWLSAFDERIKASVPVVSVGTFDAYIMNSNCVCELLPDGFTLTEEAGVLGLIAPRALKICNALLEQNRSFLPSEMLRSYETVAPLFEMLGAKDRLSYQLFNQPHGYGPEIREAMLGWFDWNLKGTGTGAPKKTKPYPLLSIEKLAVFPPGQRDSRVVSTATFCQNQGDTLRKQWLSGSTIDAKAKKVALHNRLRLQPPASLNNVHHYGPTAGWNRIALQTSDNQLLPLLIRQPAKPTTSFVIVCHPAGKNYVTPAILREHQDKAIVLLDVWGTGESTSTVARQIDGQLPAFHTLARSTLWLGKTVMGHWIRDLRTVTAYLQQEHGAKTVEIDGSRETGLAALFFSTTTPTVQTVTLRDSPVSYRFDNRDSVDHFSMAVHVPGILNWGDVSLAAALGAPNVRFINPVTIAGRPLSESQLTEFKQEFVQLRQKTKQKGQLRFD